MKALVLNKGGNIDNLNMKEIAQPSIDKNELLVKVHATSLNPSDFQTIEYLSGNFDDMVLGLDVAGEVVDKGSEVSNCNIGDRVFYLRQMDNKNGGFSEYSTTPQNLAFKIPDNVSYEEAVTLPGAGFTAYYILKNRFNITPNNTILIHGGSGNLGHFAIQLSKLMNLDVISTASLAKHNQLKSLGVKWPIDYKNENIEDKVNKITNNQGVKYIISSVNSEQATKDLTSLEFNGEIAFVSGFPNFNNLNFYDKSITMHEIAFGKLSEQNDEENLNTLSSIANDLTALVANNRIATPAKTIIKLDEVKAYLKKLKNNETNGKIIVTDFS